MSAVSTLEATPPFVPRVGRRSTVTIQDRVTIPGWIDDLESYRRWAHSDEYPSSGWFSYLDGEIWVDTDMEELITHNLCKSAYTYAVMDVLRKELLGEFVSDRMLLTNAAANLSTEPDGLFYFWSTVQSGQLRLVPGKTFGFIELEGTPDMTLEIVSQSSIRKDNVTLRDLYWKAGVAEYWLVDARGETPRFDILRHTSAGYAETECQDGWLHSRIFGCSFRLARSINPLGHPRFIVETKR